MVSILHHHILSILHIPSITSGSPTQQDPLPQALSQSSQDHKDMKIQDQDSGLAWELEEY